MHILSVDSGLSGDFSLKRRINMSCSHIMDNIAGGFGRGGNKEFIYYLLVAKGALFEFKSQLYRVLDKRYINDESFRSLYDKTESLGSMLDGLIKYLQNSGESDSKPLENENQLYLYKDN
ncbi:MAG: four helix bundle protein [Cytophagales bacterium]|nr:four helix bundle protein [Cytophagales bacterium]